MSSKKTGGLTAKDFVHLHNHTHHSVLDGLQKIPAMVDRVKELGMESVAITDHGTLSGTIELYKTATEEGIRPIIGMETYVASRGHLDKDPTKDKARHHLILLAMNNVGYENLMRLSTIANLDGFYHKPRVDHDLLEKYNEGLIVLSGCIGGEVGENLRYDQLEKAEEIAAWYKGVFGDRYYLELQDHGHMWAEQGRVNNRLISLSEKLAIPMVVTADAHYTKHDDQEAHEVLLCIQTGSFLSEDDRMSLTDTDLYLTDPVDIIKRWSDTPGAVINTAKIAERCNVEIKLGEILIPTFPLPDPKMTEQSYLHELLYHGLVDRYLPEEEHAKLSIMECQSLLTQDVLDRAQYELDTIEKMGFEGYFLIVQDFLIWGKSKDIVFGPGRGSAAGSIVSYGLKITDLDPLEHDLLFERFLNPDRISMPDIDIDIQDNRRDEVIQYCIDKYGQDSVANIVTFGTMAARNSIRDVARVLEVPYAESDRLAKMVPPPVQGRHIPLKVSVVENKELKHEYDNNPTATRVFDLAIRLEGTIRSHGVHAAGVVIAPDELVKFTPLEMSQKGAVATQYPMGPVEDLGLLKMDFLGLSNLTIVKNAIRIIRKVDGVEIDINNIDMTDKKTYDLLGRGETTGVFQFESGGMKRYLKDLKPSVFDDIVAMGALYRPGPLTAGYTDKFVARKSGGEAIVYEHELMKPALESTYGVIVYQEQVMRIARDMCGFTGGQADTLRKAVAKKKRDVMSKMKKEFTEGMIEHSGVTKEFANKFWSDLEGFADYAFPKAHSACYGLISFWTAYLKANYPAAFMAAVMTSDFDDTDRLAIEITECRHIGIEVLAPDVNESFLEFGVVPETRQIRFGMAAVKNVGTGAVEEILRAREAGRFVSVEDFVNRVSTRIVNRKTWESLIKAGAFDQFSDRAKLLFNLDMILAYGQKIQKEIESGQSNLFGESIEESVSASLQLEEPPEPLEEKDALIWERELLGLYLSKHPLDGYDEYLEENSVAIANLNAGMDKKKVTVGGVITAVREITTKNGAKMAFVGIEDKSSELELIVFPKAYADAPDIWQSDNVLIATGKINTKDRDGNSTEEIKVLVDSAKLITSEALQLFEPTGKTKTPPKSSASTQTKKAKASSVEKKLYMHIKKPDDENSLLALKKILNDFPGDKEAILVIGETNKSAIRLPFKVEVTDDLTAQIGELLSPDCVAVK